MLVQVGVDVLGGGGHGWRRWVAEVEVGDAELEWRCGIEWRVEGGVWRWWREWRMACGGYNGGSVSTQWSASVSMLSPSVSTFWLRPRWPRCTRLRPRFRRVRGHHERLAIRRQQQPGRHGSKCKIWDRGQAATPIVFSTHSGLSIGYIAMLYNCHGISEIMATNSRDRCRLGSLTNLLVPLSSN